MRRMRSVLLLCLLALACAATGVRAGTPAAAAAAGTPAAAAAAGTGSASTHTYTQQEQEKILGESENLSAHQSAPSALSHQEASDFHATGLSLLQEFASLSLHEHDAASVDKIIGELELEKLEEGEKAEVEAIALVETGAQTADPALFYDAANGNSALRAPYLPSTVNGPMYTMKGPQSGAAKGWLSKAAEPAWSALPYGPRTPAKIYILPWDHTREVHDEFSWNYNYQEPATPPQFAFAAPIFLEQGEQVQGEQWVQAVEVENLEAALDQSHAAPQAEEDASLLDVSSQGPPNLLSDDFWSRRPAGPSFNSYTMPYHDLVHPTLVGSNADARFGGTRGASNYGWQVPVRHAMHYAYHQNVQGTTLPPFAHNIEPFAHLNKLAPNAVLVGENDNTENLFEFVEMDAEREAEDGCVNCQFN